MTKKILFVCLGNICRSPMADGLLRQKVKHQNLAFEVDSAGTAAYHIGEAPDKRMIATARNFGTDISFLRARQFQRADFDQFDYIFAMDESNYHNIVKQSNREEDKAKVKLFLPFIQHEHLDEVPDPYYGTQEDFNFVYSLLDDATDKLIDKIVHER